MITSQSTLSQIEDEEAVTTDLHAKPTDIYDTSAIHDALSVILSEAQRVVGSTHSELQRTQENATSGLSDGFSKEYLAAVFRSLSKTERLLASYVDDTTDSQQLWEYILQNQRAPGEEEIFLDIQPDQIRVYLPYLPRRREGYRSPVNKMLAAKIYASSKSLKWPKWKAEFTHVYPTSVRRIPKDVDNYDYKKTIDLLAFLVGTSDNARNYSMSLDTLFTDSLRSGVYIRIAPKSSENGDIDPVKVFENTPLSSNKKFL